uniref:Cytochrome c oxidase subunit 8 n=1 Tax=Bos mutus grunniens TaxID=30521 RepID=A0A8B9XIW9_BOSMU
ACLALHPALVNPRGRGSGPGPSGLMCVFSTQEQTIGLSVTFLSFLLPAGWVLYHLDNYKKSSAA